MTTATTVQSLYIAYFNRAADPLGLAYWVDQIDNKGQTITSVANNFALQTEYASAFAGLNTTQAVNQLYVNLFNHGADLPGLTYWVGQINSGAMTMGKLAIAILAGATGADATAVTSKLAAAATFTADLNTGADVVAYNGSVAFAIAKAWLAPVVDATTLTTAQNSAVTTINNMVTAVANSQGQTFQLTTGIDNFVGGNGNDTFIGNTAAGALAFTSLDSIDGGGGINTFNITTIGNVDTTTALSTNVKNIQIANITSTGSVTTNTSAWTGMQTLNVVSNGGDTVTASGTTAITVTDASAAGAVSVTGGSTVNVTTAGTGAVGVTGGTSVTVASAGGVVTVVDPNQGTATANTLTTVSLTGYAAGSAIKSDALATITLANSAKDVTITNATAGHSDALTVNNLGAGAAFTDATATTLNVTTATKNSALNVTAAKVAALTVAGTNALDLTGSTMAKLATVTVSGAAGVTGDFSGATVTSVDSSASTGNMTIKIDDTAASFKGGTGVSTVTIVGDALKSIAAGSGTTDVLVANAAGATFTAANTGANVTGFEILRTGAASTGTYDMTVFSTETSIDVNVAAAGALAFSNAAAGTTLAIDVLPGQTVTYGLKTSTSNDSVSLSLSKATVDGVDFSANAVTLTNIQNVTVNSIGNNTAGTNVNKLNLSDALLAKLIVTGSESLTISGATGAATLKTIDATALTKGLTLDITADTAGLVTTGVTVTSGAGNVKFTDANLAAAKTDTVTLGDGNNVIKDTSATTGVMNVTAGNGNNTIDVSASLGNDTIIVGNGNNTITVGGGAGNTGLNVVTLGTGTDSVTVATAGANGNLYTTVNGFIKGDSITLGAVATATTTVKFDANKVTLAATAVFQDYLNAAIKQANGDNNGAAWFQFSGDTYVVESGVAANVAHTSFVNASDFVVKLAGIQDLTTATIAAGAITHG